MMAEVTTLTTPVGGHYPEAAARDVE